jgi:hypothetical protein
MALLLKHQTAEQFVARVREAYRDGDRDRVIQIARFIISRIQAGDITDAQCRTAFGVTTTKWNSIKTKMNNWITAQNTVQSAVGE